MTIEVKLHQTDKKREEGFIFALRMAQITHFLTNIGFNTGLTIGECGDIKKGTYEARLSLEDDPEVTAGEKEE